MTLLQIEFHKPYKNDILLTEVLHMKQRYVPLEKQSKGKQKEYHAKQRRDWGNLNPVTKKLENGKAYNRKKSKHWCCEHEPGLDFLVVGNIFYNMTTPCRVYFEKNFYVVSITE